jgi:hypothetical protein
MAQDKEKWQDVVAAMKLVILRAEALVKSEEKPVAQCHRFRPVELNPPALEPKMHVVDEWESPTGEFLQRS